MKRLILLLLCLVLAVALGCRTVGDSSVGSDAYDLYFREADLEAVSGGDALRAEKVVLPAEVQGDVTKTAEALVKRLLAGPVDETLRSPFPVGTIMMSLEVDGGRALVDMSSSYGNLSGVALTLADYAITLTLTQLPEISVVNVTVRGKNISYRSTQDFTEKDVLFSTTEDVVSTLPVTLYFPDESGSLAPEEAVLELYEGDTQVGAVIKALENGPAGKHLRPVFPEGFQVKAAWLEDDICYVNLSSAALADLPEGSSLQTAAVAMVRSLNSLEQVGEVRFMMDGEFVQNYGAMPVKNPILP